LTKAKLLSIYFTAIHIDPICAVPPGQRQNCVYHVAALNFYKKNVFFAVLIPFMFVIVY